MISNLKFAHYKFVRYIAYAIVAGFALMMALPGSMGLADFFSGSSGSSFITVNGKEVFSRQAILQRFEKSFDDFNVPKQYKQYRTNLVLQILEGWKNPRYPLSGELYQAIMQQMHLQLADDLDYSISEGEKGKLNHLIRKKFQQFVKDEYLAYQGVYFKNPKNKNKPPMNKNVYYEEEKDYLMRKFNINSMKPYLKKNYLVRMVLKPIQRGNLVPIADVLKEYKTDNHKVQVDFALYTYDHFVKELPIKNKIKEKDLKEYYRFKEKMNVKKTTFRTKKAAQKAKTDPNLFKSDSKKPIEIDPKKPNIKKPFKNKYQMKETPVMATNKLFDKLKKYKKGQITKIMSGEGKDKQFYIYKIIKKDKNFAQIKKSSSEYRKLMTDFVRARYNKFKSDYEKRANVTLKAFLTKVKRGASFKDIIYQDDRFSNIKVGRTEFFSQKGYINQAGNVVSEVTLLKKKKLAETSNKKKPDQIEEFLSINPISNEKTYNKKFFKSAFSLGKGNVSSILSEELKGKKVFFLVKKVNEKQAVSKAIPKSEKRNLENGRVTYNKKIVNGLWLNYLIKLQDNPVEINEVAILKLLKLPLPLSPGSSKNRSVSVK